MADGSLIFDTKINSSGFSSGLGKLGSLAKTGLKAATTAIVAMSAYSIKVGSDFEASMSKVQAISGASGAQLEALRDKAKEMGQTTKFSASEAAEAMNYMAMAGWKTEDMLSGISGVMNLAAASGEDLATTSDIVTDALTAFGMSASDSTHFADVLAAATSNANTTVSGMGETFKYVGSMAGALGYSIEDVSLATGLMANSGIKGTQAGTALNAIMTRLSTNTNGAADAIQELGVSFYDSQGNARDLSDVMDELREATSGMNNEQKSALANTVAGMEAQKGLLAILNASESDYQALSKAINNADGAAQDMADTMQNNLQGKFTIMKSSLESLGIATYEKMQKPLTKAVESATQSINKLTKSMTNGKLSQSFDQLGEAMGSMVSMGVDLVTAALPPMINGLSWFISHGKGVASAIIGIKTAMIAMRNASTIASTFNTAKTAISLFASTATSSMGLATKATELFSLATMAIPTTALVGGLVAVTTALTAYAAITLATSNNVDKQTQATNELVESHKTFTKELNENKQARQEAIDQSTDESSKASILASRLDDLAQKTNKTAGEKKLMASYVEQLNELIPGLNLVYNEEADALNKSTQEINNHIAALKQEALATAYREQLQNATTDLVEVETQLSDAQKVHAQNTKEVEQAQKAYDKALQEATEHGKTAKDVNDKYGKALNEASLELQKTTKNQKESGKVVDDLKSKQKDLNDEIDSYANLEVDASDFQTKLNNVYKMAVEAGIEIPEKIAEGMNEGSIVIPETVDELKNLINLEDLVDEYEAKNQGQKVPDSVTEGINSGKYKIPGTLDELEDLIRLDDLSSQYQEANEKGKELPESVASGIKSGQYAVPQSLEEMQSLVKYDKFLSKASEVGIAIPEEIRQGIADGSLKPSEAIEKMNESGYNTLYDFVTKAKEQGIEIPENVAQGIADGSMEPQQAMEAMKDQITLSDLIEKAELDGNKIPTSVSQGINNGSYKVPQSVDELKRLIKLDALAPNAEVDGQKIPDDIYNGIISGKMKMPESIDQLKTLLNSEAETLDDDMEGYGADVSGGISDGMEAKRNLPINSATLLKKDVLNALTDDGNEFSTVGSTSATDYTSGIGSTEPTATNVGNAVKLAALNAITGGKFSESGSNSGQAYADGVSSKKTAANTSGTNVKNEALSGISGGDFNGKGSSAGQKYADGIGSKKSTAKTKGSEVNDNAISGLSKADGYNSGRNVVQGFINGMGSLASTVVSVGMDIGRNAIGGIKSGSGIGSPSRYTKQFGKWIDEGLEIGMKARLTQVKEASSLVAETAMSSLNDFETTTVGQKIARAFMENANLLKQSADAVVSNFVKSASVPNLATVGATGGQTINYTFNQNNEFTSTGALQPSEQAMEMKRAVERMEWQTRRNK